MRLTDKQKAEVATDYAAGKSKTEIARKFGVSDVAISKILKKLQSSEKFGKFGQSSETVKTQSEIRREIIDKATNALYGKDYDKLPPEFLLKIIERLSLLEQGTKAADEVRIIIERNVVDLTSDDPDNV